MSTAGQDGSSSRSPICGFNFTATGAVIIAMDSPDEEVSVGRSRGKEIALNVAAVAEAHLHNRHSRVPDIRDQTAGVSLGFDGTCNFHRCAALAKTVPATELAVGDVISVDNDQGVRITPPCSRTRIGRSGHRARHAQGRCHTMWLIDCPTTITEADRVFISVGGLGYVVAWLSSPLATFLGGGLVGAVLVIAFGRTKDRRLENARAATTNDARVDADETCGELQEAHND